MAISPNTDYNNSSVIMFESIVLAAILLDTASQSTSTVGLIAPSSDEKPQTNHEMCDLFCQCVQNS